MARTCRQTDSAQAGGFFQPLVRLGQQALIGACLFSLSRSCERVEIRRAKWHQARIPPRCRDQRAGSANEARIPPQSRKNCRYALPPSKCFGGHVGWSGGAAPPNTTASEPARCCYLCPLPLWERAAQVSRRTLMGEGFLRRMRLRRPLTRHSLLKFRTALSHKGRSSDCCAF
jgi:hypothetical protein